MREILFKAKRIDNSEWVYGYYLCDGITGKVYIHDSGNSVNESDKVGYDGYLQFVAYEIDPETICQYTGLIDKNGEKIWENDILKAHLDKNYPQDITYTKIIWNECRFCTNENHSIDIETLDKWDAEHYEVCGNVFDNPDLLEVE